MSSSSSSSSAPAPLFQKEERKFDTNVTINEYKFVLLNKTNYFHPPSTSKPMIRIVGFAYTYDEAEAMKSRILEHKGAKYIPLFIEPVGCLQMIGLTPKRHLDIETVKHKKDHVFDAHDSWNKKRAELFKNRMEQKNRNIDAGAAIEHRNEVLKIQEELLHSFPMPDDDARTMFELSYCTGRETDTERENLYKNASSLPKTPFSADQTNVSADEWKEVENTMRLWPNELINPDQHWVSITVIPDFSVQASNWIEAHALGNEPFYIIHTCAQTASEIEKITENKIWSRFSDADTYIHQLYKWMDFTTIFDDSIKTNWMDPELDKIMNNDRKERKIASRVAAMITDEKERQQSNRINVSKPPEKDTSVLDFIMADDSNYVKNQQVRFKKNSDSVIDKLLEEKEKDRKD
jgi:hypothetical protein